MRQLSKIKIFSGNTIKIIAAICMLLDHVGVLWNIDFLRIIGRISMPLFAFMVAEGCSYTKNKVKHFSLIFLLAMLCQIVYAITMPGEIYLSILFTFSLSTIAIYALQHFKICVFNGEVKIFDKIISGLLFIGIVTTVYFINCIQNINRLYFYIDYGFWGCMLPVFVSLFDFKNVNLPQNMQWLNSYYLKLLTCIIGLVFMCVFGGMAVIQWYSLIAIVPLLLYNNTNGKYKLKYFFYLFYPIHLAGLYGIFMLCNLFF